MRPEHTATEWPVALHAKRSDGTRSIVQSSLGLVLIITITLSAFPPGALAQIVSNGGFEIPLVAPGSVTYTNGQSFGGWTVDLGSVSLQSQCPPLSRLQSAYLPWTFGSNTIHQDLNTVVGNQYILSYTRACGDGCGCDAITHRVFVGWGAKSVTDDRAWNWAENSYIFTATGTTTRLSFSGSDVSLDDVSVVPVAPPGIMISRIVSTTNGLALSWSVGESNTAYTVQTRGSLSAGVWQNAPMRYRWPWPFSQWADAAQTARAPRFYRVMAETVSPPRRGKLLTNSAPVRLSTNQLRQITIDWLISGFVTSNFSVNRVRFAFETVDPFGFPILASALLLTPQGATGPLPIVSIQMGSIALKSRATSLNYDSWEYGFAAAFATLGYVAVVPDYIGLGDSPGYQAYMHAKTEATTVVDALRAARTLCASNQLSLNGQLFLHGYSQGGHATMAAHRELEIYHTNEFAVTASAPAAGAYDLGGVAVDSVLANPTANPNPWYLAQILAAYLPIYNLGATLEEVLAEPYRRTLPPVLDGFHNVSDIAARMPADMLRILRPDFQSDFRTNASNPLRLAARDNNVYEWTPKAPIKMLQCSGDRDVVPANATVAYESFTNRGACCIELVDPGAPQKLNHGACLVPSFRAALTWFEQLKR